MTLEQRAKKMQMIKGIIMGRWFFIIGLTLSGLVQVATGIGATSLSPTRLFFLFTIPSFYNVLSMLYTWQKPERVTSTSLRVASFLQVFIDLLMVTGIIYATGGIESISFPMYFFPILSATLLFSDLILAGFSLITVALYSLLITLEFHHIIPHRSRYGIDPNFFGDIEVTLFNTITVNLFILLTAIFCIYVGRVIHDRELQITIERDKVRSTVNSLQDGIIMIDQHNHVLLMNPLARDYLRLYQTLPHAELVEIDFPPHLRPLVHMICEKTKTRSLGKQMTLEEGENRYHFTVDSIPIAAVDGSIVSWVKVVHDITREKELEQVKSDFISIAAHQLRTPLAGLKWFFKLMMDGDAGPVTKEQVDLLGKAYQRNNHVIDIVNNLLNISEIEEGRMTYDFQKGDVKEILQDLQKASALDAERKQIQVKTDFFSGKAPLDMDKQKLSMAFQNIIDNALKYSPQQSTVTVTLKKKADQYLVTIQDQGIGISTNDRSKIFSKFYRGKNAREKETTGSGLGLYIVKNIVQRHHGQIWFESQMNKGTTFYISLPISRQYFT